VGPRASWRNVGLDLTTFVFLRMILTKMYVGFRRVGSGFLELQLEAQIKKRAIELLSFTPAQTWVFYWRYVKIFLLVMRYQPNT
jgi:hypothetical protein